MDHKRLTLIVLSPKRGKVGQLKAAKVWFVVVGVLFFSSLLFGAYGVNQYLTFVEERRLLAKLEDESRSHEKQFESIGSEMEELRQQLIRLNKLDKKIRIIANLEDNTSEIQFSGMGGVNPEEGILQDLKREPDDKWAERIHEHFRRLQDMSDQQEASLHYLEEALLEKQDLLACTPSIWPTRGWLTCSFGYRRSPFTGVREFHGGVDVATKHGTPVIAPADGVVVDVGSDRGFGRFLRLEHGFGYETFYAHLDEVVAKKGQEVHRGEMVATVGNSGRSTGPHLHYEIHVKGLPVSPLRYILD